jgi:hypothetical protein
MSDGPAAASRRRRLRPLGLALLGLLLAGLGERAIRTGNVSGLGAALYAAGIAAFFAAAPRFRLEPGAAGPARGRNRAAVLVPALLAMSAVAANAVALGLYARDTLSKPAVSLWLASLVLIAAAGVVGWRANAWTPRWNEPALPESRAGRILFAGAVLAIVAGGIAARYSALDRIPVGINADEGDRAATSIQFLRGVGDHHPFGAGWYHISNVYFRLLAVALRISGEDYVGARTFGAFFGVLGLLAVIAIGARHFGWRAGLFAGGLTAVLGAVLQFSRQTSESGPTAVLWALSALFFLEGARTGRLLSWILAGLAGGFSIYFYPPGRMWPLVAALFGLYVLLRGLAVPRGRVFVSVAAAAVAALLVSSPFLWGAWTTPGSFTVRARETTIFVKENPRRLAYYNPTWSTPRLVAAQVERAFGVFNRFPDANYFWPCDRPVLPPALTVLFFLGLGGAALSVRDPRRFLLATWFLVGFSGVVVTVETPALQRMAPAILTLGLFPAIALSDVVRRVAGAAPEGAGRMRAAVAGLATAAAAVVVLGAMDVERRFYFGTYATVDGPYSYPTNTGRTVAAQGHDTWVLALGPEFHMTNSGWVRLLAPETPHGGVLSPGSTLPLPLPANRNLAFLVYPRQPYYLPLLREIYPGGVETRVEKPHNGFMYTVYRIEKDAWKARRGVLATPSKGAPATVPSFGAVPPGVSGAVVWSASLRVPRYWNYAFRAGPGPARLLVDGVPVVSVPRGTASGETVNAVARGDHFVVLEGEAAGGRGPSVEWAEAGETAAFTAAPPRWEPFPGSRLTPRGSPPGGLAGTVTIDRRPEIRRLDGALATGGLADEIHFGQPFRAEWTGFLSAPVAGTYRMTVVAPGETSISVDGRDVLATDGKTEGETSADVSLSAGRHAVAVRCRVERMPGVFEWRWTPPGGADAIVPPSALSPPAAWGVFPPQPLEALGPAEFQPRDQPVAIRW